MKISVVVPVYNAEKYLPACLESLLIQTLTDFEVIVVDDCSTDNSVAVAENFLERFNGRLKIISLDANTGSGAVPRNVGLEFSRGKYVYFMDADDVLIDTALEELFNAAESFDAEVVCMESGFTCAVDLNPETLNVAAWDKNPSPVNEPTLEPDDLPARMTKLFETGYGWAPWIKFLRRDFLIDNGIKFPRMRISEDVAWTIELVLKAKRWLRVPAQLYIYRRSENSMTRSRRSPREEIKFWLDPLVKGLDYLDGFLDEISFFAQNPNYRFDVTNFFVKMQLAGMLGALEKLNRNELYEIIHREFSANGGRHAALIANLFVFMNFYRDEFLNSKPNV